MFKSSFENGYHRITDNFYKKSTVSKAKQNTIFTSVGNTFHNVILTGKPKNSTSRRQVLSDIDLRQTRFQMDCGCQFTLSLIQTAFLLIRATASPLKLEI